MQELIDKLAPKVAEIMHEQHDDEKHGFFSSMMSMDEARVSALMLSLLVSLGFGGYAYLEFGDVSEKWTSLIETFAYCVTGINMLATINPRSRIAKVIANLSESADQMRTTGQKPAEPEQQAPAAEQQSPAVSVEAPEPAPVQQPEQPVAPPPVVEQTADVPQFRVVVSKR